MFGKALDQNDCNPVKSASPMHIAQRSMASGSLLTPLSLRVLVHILENEAPTHRTPRNCQLHLSRGQDCWSKSVRRTGCFGRRTPLLRREAGGGVHDRSICQAGLIAGLGRHKALGRLRINGAPRMPTFDRNSKGHSG